MAHLLIMEGNTIARQNEAAALGVRSASGVYREAVLADFPDLHVDVVHAADPGQTPPDGRALADYDALIVGGSGLHAYDTDFAVTNQIAMLRAFAETGKPILGSCWGLQIAAIAGGGEVRLSPNGREVIVARKIRKLGAGLAHPFLAGRGDTFDAPCIHYDEVTALPPGSQVLCGNAHSAIQGAIVPLGKSEVWAVQYHPEFDLDHLRMLVRLYAAAMLEQGFFADEDERAHYEARLALLHADPGNRAAAWQLGIDADLLDARRRRSEIIAWIERCVLPAARA
ncbi:glutamine amidotransferase [Porphyrobacter sp. TH134]|uniref:type 1 glutamine amidotransferase n=1 Tax=Porphyrobacter sp. TH134 TaxID=2067450 RepID=UPI000C7CD708|nr:type 1 glutamine amidotransferase [Porphyrobacter sp. TH134]PLK22805.1 glutamine amidotransferase [Porphyrobacter sp. TH134]